MMNWIYYQMAMYYLRKAHNTPIMNPDLWVHYMNKSRNWASKVKS